MPSYHESGFPIWQADTARAANRSYFNTLSPWRAGIGKKILGNIIGDMRANCSYMIVRRSHRTPKPVMHMQQAHAGMRGYMRAARTMYVIARSDYVIARQSWSNGEIEELEVFNSPAEARKAFKARTGRGAYGDWATTPE